MSVNLTITTTLEMLHAIQSGYSVDTAEAATATQLTAFLTLSSATRLRMLTPSHSAR